MGQRVLLKRIEHLANEIRKEFPRIPKNDAKRCARQMLLNKNIANVLKPKEGWLDAHVRAFIRHRFTTYEGFILLGIPKGDCRKWVEEEARKVYDMWKGGEPKE